MTVERSDLATWTVDKVRVTLRPGDGDCVRVTIDPPRGGVSTATRRRVVHTIVSSGKVRSAHQLQMTIPLGDAVVLEELRKELEVVQTRAAGASCLVDARRRSPARAEPGARAPGRVTPPTATG